MQAVTPNWVRHPDRMLRGEGVERRPAIPADPEGALRRRALAEGQAKPSRRGALAIAGEKAGLAEAAAIEADERRGALRAMAP